MSKDLISRSALMSHIESQYREWGEDYDAEQILGDIEDFKTAYDVDKVVEQLEELKIQADKDMQLSDEYAEAQGYGGLCEGYEEAIKIVKAGGTNG